MSYNGFIKIPRSLLSNPLWKDMPPAYKEVFLVILENVCFKPKKFDDHGKVIYLKPGQICISERDLLGLCGKWITRNDIQRTLVKLKLYGFSSQEVIHKKTVITITHPDIYDQIKSLSEPTSDPIHNQSTAINEEGKEKQEEKERQQEEKNVVVFHFLKDLDLTDSDRKSLMKFSEQRVSLAIEFVNHPKTVIKKNFISTLIWHCTQDIPPKQIDHSLTPQQKLALDHLDLLRYEGLKAYEEENKDLIAKEGFMLWIGGKTTLSLKNPISEIRKDFTQSLNELRDKKNKITHLNVG